MSVDKSCTRSDDYRPDKIASGGPLDIASLERMATQIRCDIVEMTHKAQAGHPGGPLSATDIVTALYFRVMRIDPSRPGWPDRDRSILSKGHACPAWNLALAERWYFDKAHLGTLCQLGSILQGRTALQKTPGIDMSAGSLGPGPSSPQKATLPTMAWAARWPRSWSKTSRCPCSASAYTTRLPNRAHTSL